MKKNKLIVGTLALFLAIAIAAAIYFAGKCDTLSDKVEELETKNRKYLAENSCLQAENKDLGNAVSALNATVLDLHGQNATLTEKILEIHPWIGAVLDLTADGVWCSRVPGHLEKARPGFLEWHRWVQENMKAEIEAKKKK